MFSFQNQAHGIELVDVYRNASATVSSADVVSYLASHLLGDSELSDSQELTV